MIFEDDPYVELRFEGEPLPRMLELDAGARRLRVVVLEDRLPRHPRRLPRRPAGADRRDPRAGHQHLHLAVDGRGVDRQRVLPLGRARAARSRRCARRSPSAPRTLAAALQRELPEARFHAPQGGYFLWVELPEGADVAALFDAAEERGVVFVKGTDFVLEGGENTLRLAYSGVTPAEIEEGVSRLAEAYRAVAVAA